MGIGFAPPEVFLAEIQKIKTLTSKPFGCNLITDVPYSETLLQIILEEKVPVVELESAALIPKVLSSYADRLKAAGIVIIAKVATVKQALLYEEVGVDFISVKGADGGGHIYGFTGTFTLIPQVVDRVKIPVINSSGVADGRGIAASFMLGASAVEIGSRFLLAYECQVHENYKNAIIQAEEGDTVLTGTSVDDAVRGLTNNLSEKVLLVEKQYNKEESSKIISELCSGSLRKAAIEGEVEDEGTVVVGQNIGLLTKKQSTQEIMDELIQDYRALLSKSNGYL